MSKVIRIGTRDSALALWQANTVKQQLEALGYTTQLVAVKSTGDLVLDQPLYELGITGIFTKTLDVAMLNGSIDIAVHSMKDVPTLLPKGIVQTAVLERASSKDILVTKEHPNFDTACTIATGSLRRKAQWLHRYPHHNVVGLRGNVNTRLQKLADSDWQGAMMIVALENDLFCREAAALLNHPPTQTCTYIEREFLRVLEGGCTAPIGAFAYKDGDTIHFKGCLFSLDGSTELKVERSINTDQYLHFGEDCAKELLNNGGVALMKSIKSELS